MATGSPFDPVKHKDKTYEIAQSNNVYIFPGLGLGVLASGAKRISNEMMMAAAEALAADAPIMSDPNGSLLAHLEDIQKVSRDIAFAVAREAQEQGRRAGVPAPTNLKRRSRRRSGSPSTNPIARPDHQR